MRKAVTASLFAVVVLCLAVLSADEAQAHVLKSDGSMGAILHIQPDDAPVAQVPTTYVLSFQETAGSFSLGSCTCGVTILSDNMTVATQSLSGSGTVGTSTYTFSKVGVYDIRVAGRPKSGSSFAPFTLDYIIRVNDGSVVRQQFPVLLWIGIGMGVALILLYANVQGYNEKNAKKGRK